ncbi:hypothetical protein B0H10DRAFT_1380563 [Mycena sp. CBHHK59/15]|nr:hypothetical protein B0H10DRAFT_1380563 [Mycena sp. CBHHK59/15]
MKTFWSLSGFAVGRFSFRLSVSDVSSLFFFFEQCLAETPAQDRKAATSSGTVIAKSKPKTPEASTSQQKSGHEAATAVAGRPPSARRSPPSRLRESPVASTSGYELNTRAINKHGLGPDSSPRPPKRVRTGDAVPSLLSRLGTSASAAPEQRPTTPSAAQKNSNNAVSAAVMDSGMDEEKTPRGGYSIKGAASAKAGEPRRAGASTSLLERMNGGGGGGGDDRVWRKNRWS